MNQVSLSEGEILDSLDTFEKRFDAVVEAAKRMMRSGYEHVSTLHMHDADGKVYVLSDVFKESMSSTHFCSAARELIKHYGIVEYQFHSCAWCVQRTGKPGDGEHERHLMIDELRGTVAEQPDKKELLFIIGVQLVDGELIKKSRAFTIDRNPQGKVLALIEMKEFRDVAMMYGQFAELLDPFPMEL